MEEIIVLFLLMVCMCLPADRARHEWDAAVPSVSKGICRHIQAMPTLCFLYGFAEERGSERSRRSAI